MYDIYFKDYKLAHEDLIGEDFSFLNEDLVSKIDSELREGENLLDEYKSKVETIEGLCELLDLKDIDYSSINI